jgi:hypothetical protein
VALQVRRTRRAENHKFRKKKPHWVDPYPQILGTLPEKMLFAALVARRIFFVFQGDLQPYVHGKSAMLQATAFEPDILLPEYNVILDPFGEFAHTQVDSIERDRRKAVYYWTLGYTFYHPWAQEVTVSPGPEAILDQVIEIRKPKVAKLAPIDLPFRAQGYRLGKNLGAGATGTALGNKARAAHRLKAGQTLKRGTRTIRRGR